MTTVLVVDDSQVDRTLVEGLLKRAGHATRSAAHGAQALSVLAQGGIDLVVTDLQMPEVDGLQLVTAVRLEFPHVPVVLITAHGSEGLALQALEQGAASYVAKPQLAERLVDTVDQVVSHAAGVREYLDLAERLEFADLQFSLSDERAMIVSFVELVQRLAVSLGVCSPSGQVRFGMAVEEALSYLQLRGNYELTEEQLQEVHLRTPSGESLLAESRRKYPDRRLKVNCRFDLDGVVLTIAHAGSGISRPQAASDELEQAANRSLVLMSAFLDDVKFNAATTEVVLLKRRET